MEQTISERIRNLIGEDSPYDVSRRFALKGVALTPQAVYKWLAGGEIGEENLRVLCEIYGGEAPYIRYGIKGDTDMRNGQRAAAELIGSAPPEVVKLTMDFMEYQIQKSEVPAVQQNISIYMKMIDRIMQDIDNRKTDQLAQSKNPAGEA